jgi:macrolide-specific efflux system membrane fusion protein
MGSRIEDHARQASRKSPFAVVLRHPYRSALVAVLLIAGAYWTFSNDDGPTTRPLFATVEVGDIENAVTAAGFLQPSTFVDVGAQVSGQLEALHVEVGDVVAEGDLLAEIDATVQFNRVEASRASLRALEAQLSAREASLKLATANAERQARLMDDDATTESDFDNAMNSLASAQSSLTQLQSQIAQSKASLASDEAQLGYTKIYAPASGTVVSIDKKVGQTLNANQQTPIILRIADLTTMTVEAEVSEADVTKLRVGMEVYFTTLGSSGRRWYAKLRQVLPTPTVTNNVVLYTALFDVENTDGTLFSNMTAQIFFITSSARNVLKVPVGALTYAAGSGQPTGAAQAFAMGGDFGGGDVGGGMGGGDFGGGMGGGDFGGGMGGGNFGGGMGGDGMGDFAERMANMDPEARDALQKRITERMAQRDGASGRADTTRPAVATVQVAVSVGEFETREIRVGVTSRIAAEVLSGLEEGEQVVAGVLQSREEEDDQQRSRNSFRFR